MSKKKIGSLLLAMCMLFSMFITAGPFAVNAAAADEIAISASDLAAKVSGATADTVIELDASFPTSLTGVTSLTNTGGYDITIDGNGIVLTAASSRHFTASAGSGKITFTNIVFDGASAAGGVTARGNVAFENCAFTNNVGGVGAAITLDSNCDVVVEKCSFMNNKNNWYGYTGGAIGVEKSQNVKLEVTESYFKDNEGPIPNTSSTKHSGGLGGGITLYMTTGSSLIVDSCVFDENRAVGRSTVSDGGAIAIKNNGSGDETTFSITNSTFFENVTEDDGGAIMIEGKSASKVSGSISNCTFMSNNGKGDSAGSDGGAIQFFLPSGAVEVTYCTFYGNKIGGNMNTAGTALVSTNGGALATGTSGNVANNLFVENENVDNGMAYYQTRKNVASGVDKGGNAGFDKGAVITYTTGFDEFGRTTPVLAENGEIIIVGHEDYQTELKTLLIAPVAEAENTAIAATGTSADNITLDQRGRARDIGGRQDAGAVEINWVKFDANSGEWSDITATGYNTAGTDYTVYDSANSKGDIRYAVDTADIVNVTVPSDPTHDSYIFVGWSTTQVTPGTGTTADCLTAAELSALDYDHQTLYAVWKTAVVTYTVTYADGVTDGSVSGLPTPNPVTETPTNTFTISNTVPTRTGYTFGGWATSDVTGTAQTYAKNETFTMPGNDVTLTAIWTPQYTVTYADGVTDGSVSGLPTPNPVTETQGNTFTVSSTVPTRSGYTFSHWATSDVTGTAQTYAANATFTMPGNDVTLTAVWTKNSSGGTGGSSGATAELIKVDAANADTKLSGAKFDLYKKNTSSDDRKVGTYTTDKDGKITIKDLSSGDYYWVEITAPEGYKLDSTKHEFKLSSSGKQTVTVENKKNEVPDYLNGEDHYAYVVGYTDGTVRPKNTISRAEVATIFFRLLKDDVRNEYLTKENDFSDTEITDWFNQNVSTMANMDIVNGDPNGTFRPNDNITRAEFAAIAARFDTTTQNNKTEAFSDIAGHWAEKEIAAAVNNGWVNGYPDGTFKPNNSITRAEAMTLINRVLQRLPETEKDLLDDMVKWPDNAPSDWHYLAVQEATNSHYYEKKTNGFETWETLRENRDWVAEFE